MSGVASVAEPVGLDPRPATRGKGARAPSLLVAPVEPGADVRSLIEQSSDVELLRKVVEIAGRRLRALQTEARAKEASAAKARGKPARPLSPSMAALSESSARRLAIFPSKQVENVAPRLTRPLAKEWPRVEGFLTILFTPRCGSTFLARELVRRFDIGKVGESFNPPRLKDRTGADVIEARRGAWFGTKLGIQGLITAELTGVVDHYLEQMVFLHLLRRDIVAQAISLAKAKQLQRFHSTGEGKAKGLVYSKTSIGNSVRAIAHTSAKFDSLLQMVGRPHRRFYYEDAGDGNLANLEGLCDQFGVPRVQTRAGRNFATLRPIRDSVNDEWAERFRQDIDPKVREAMDQYQALL